MPRFALCGIVPLSSLVFWAPAVALRPHKTKGNSSVGGKVITLGDSYSSGCGLYTFGHKYDGGDCWRDLKTTPGARFAQAEKMNSHMEACAGGELPDINQQLDKLQADFPEDAASGWAGSVIMFTIGGNDLRTHTGESWPGLLQSCIMSFYGKCHEEAQNQIANFASVQVKLVEFYDRVAKAAPNAKIRVMGYPRLLTKTWHCIPVPGLDLEAADWADEQVDELNRRINGAVSQVSDLAGGKVDIEWVDVKKFVDGGACWLTQKKINGIVLAGLSISSASFHPNQLGYTKMYHALSPALGRSVSQSELSQRALPEAIDHKESARILNGWDTDQNGKLCIGEVLEMAGLHAKPAVSKQVRSFFRIADKDQDDDLSMEEFEKFMDLVASNEIA